MRISLLTYPSEFIWYDEKDVKGTMHVMAIRMTNLQLLMDADATELDSHQRNRNQSKILDEMSMLEELAISISPTTSSVIASNDQEISATNHLLLDEHIDEFIGKVIDARQLAELSPPNYYGIGRLMGNCQACHRRH